MDRRSPAYATAALSLALIASALWRFCGRTAPVEPAAGSSLSDLFPKEKKGAAPKKTGLVAPRLLNLGELQANIRKYYPEAEHRAGKAGHVTMAMVVGTDGTVGQVRVEASGGADFDAAARKAVLAMRFSPASESGAPVAVEISQRIDFEFDGK